MALSKKELQRDEVREAAASGIEWLKEYEKEIQIGVMAVAAVSLVVALVFGFIRHRDGKAGELISEAATLFAPAGGEGPTAEGLVEAKAKLAEASALGSTPAGKLATLKRAADLASEGKVAESWADLEKAADGKGFVGAWAEYNLILAAPGAGRIEEAISRVRSNLAKDSPRLPKDLLLFSLGELEEEAGRPSEARAAYEQLTGEHPDSTFKARADERLSSL